MEGTELGRATPLVSSAAVVAFGAQIGPLTREHAYGDAVPLMLVEDRVFRMEASLVRDEGVVLE